MTEKFLDMRWEAYTKGGKQPWVLSLVKNENQVSIIAKKGGTQTISNLLPDFNHSKESGKFFHLVNSNEERLHVQIKENEKAFQECFHAFEEEELLKENGDSKTHQEKAPVNTSVLPPMEQDMKGNYTAAPPIAKVKQGAGSASKGVKSRSEMEPLSSKKKEPLSLKKNVALTKKPKIMSDSSSQDSTSDSSSQSSVCEILDSRVTKSKVSLLPPIAATTTTTSSPFKTDSMNAVNTRESVATSFSSSSSSSSNHALDVEAIKIHKDFSNFIFARAESDSIKVHDERILGQKITHAVASGFSEATVCDIGNFLMDSKMRKEL
jgi:hypothetical protein